MLGLTHPLHALWLLLLVVGVFADDEGCFSTVDTSVSKGTLQYGSQSSCSTACGSSYPYIAMKDGGECYCLSSLPTSGETSESLCDVTCNGYGDAVCGGTDAYTVFENTVYLGSVSSSKLASSSSSSSSSASSVSSSLSLAGLLTSSATSSDVETDAMITSSAGSESSDAESLMITSTVTDANGSIQYKTVTATSSSSQTGASSSLASSGSKKSTNVAPIVGGVVGGVAAAALIALGIFFFIRRRNADDDDDEEEFYKNGAAPGAGSVGRAKSNKFNSVFDMPMSNPFVHPSDEFAQKRASQATAAGLTDPRLNPVMMGRRRLSEGSLADEADYSRKILGVANP